MRFGDQPSSRAGRGSPAGSFAAARVAVLAMGIILAAAAGCAPKRVLQPPPETGAPEVGAPAADEAEPGASAVAPAAPALGPAVGEEAARGEAAARLAREMVGIAYRHGGATPAGGFDCSGFTSWVWKLQGVTLPRSSRDQFGFGRRVASVGVSPGDLVFFARDRRTVSHVGIWIGDGRFAHAPKAGEAVRIESIGDPWWASRYMGARRP